MSSSDGVSRNRVPLVVLAAGCVLVVAGGIGAEQGAQLASVTIASGLAFIIMAGVLTVTGQGGNGVESR